MSKPSELFRTQIARGIQEGKNGVDREHGIIRGYAVMTKMKDTRDNRGMEIDDTTLEQIAAAGNKFKIGMKSRFGHPGMSSEALGTFLGRSKNFRIDGDVVRADLFLDETAFKTPNGNLAEYIMDLAESDPSSFGSSVHMRDWTLDYRLEKDGTRSKDKQGNELPGLLRVKSLWACDIVEEPAANEELFNTRKHAGMPFFTGDLELSAKGAEFLDRFLSNPDAVEKVIGFLERYRANEEQPGETEAVLTTKKENPIMELKDLTIEQLQAGRPDLISLVQNAAVSELKASQKSAQDAALATERKRCHDISKFAASLAEGLAGAVKPLQEAALKAITDGVELLAAESSLKSIKLALLQTSAPAPVGHGPEEQAALSVEPSEKDGGASHLQAAKAYQLQHKCDIQTALKATAPSKQKA